MVALLLFDGVIVLIVSVYITLDGERMTNALVHVIPERWRDDAVLLMASVDKSFGGYLRASYPLSFTPLELIAMFVLGVPFALPVGISAVVCCSCPFLRGHRLPFPPIVLRLSRCRCLSTGILLAVMILLQQLVLQVLRPRIMGKEVALHPLWVLASFLIGARVAGIWGALFSVPVAAISRQPSSSTTTEQRARRLRRTPWLKPIIPGTITSKPSSKSTWMKHQWILLARSTQMKVSRAVVSGRRLRYPHAACYESRYQKSSFPSSIRPSSITSSKSW